MDEFVTEYRAEGWLEVYWRRLAVMHHSVGPAPDHLMQALIAELRRHALQGAPMDFVLIIHGGPPTPVGRRMLLRTFSEHAADFRSVTIWIGIGGLAGAVVRSVATGIFMLGGSVPTSFINGRTELIALAERHGTRAEAEALVAHVMQPVESSSAPHHTA